MSSNGGNACTKALMKLDFYGQEFQMTLSNGKTKQKSLLGTLVTTMFVIVLFIYCLIKTDDLLDR